MKIEIEETPYRSTLLWMNPEKIYVFGDNMARFGNLGQAVIRDEPNSFGIPTKRYPGRKEEDYFSDKNDEFDCVLANLRLLYKLAKNHTIVFPIAGIGTGLAQMEKRSPALWSKMNQILKDHFGYINGALKN